MKVTVGGYYHDESKDSQREVHITLDSADGKELFSSNWDEWSPSLKVKKLTAMADIYLHQYAASRNFRAEHAVAEDIERIIERDLK